MSGQGGQIRSGVTAPGSAPLPGGRKPYRAPRVAEIVADELRRQIVLGERTGELPREDVLLEQFSVSRPSMREALRILETEGLVQVRRGKVGGAEVRLPTVEGAAFHLGLVLQSKRCRLSDLAMARLEIEPVCAQKAAEQKKHEKVAEQLEAAIAENELILDGPSRDFTSNAQKFHQLVVQLCGNVTMMLLASALEAVWNVQEQQWAEQAEESGSYPEPKLRREVIKSHRAIARRIAAGDGAGARRAMHAHLAASQPFIDLQDAPIEVISPAPRF